MQGAWRRKFASVPSFDGCPKLAPAWSRVRFNIAAVNVGERLPTACELYSPPRSVNSAIRQFRGEDWLDGGEFVVPLPGTRFAEPPGRDPVRAISPHPPAAPSCIPPSCMPPPPG